jgi:hypothetical protein
VPHEGGGRSGDLPPIEQDAPPGDDDESSEAHLDGSPLVDTDAADGESSEAHIYCSPSVDTDVVDPPSIPDDITKLESVPPVVFDS